MTEAVIRALTMYPVKGCQGTPVQEAMITRAGFADDRLFAMLGADGVPLDQIEAPQLGGLGVAWDAKNARLSFSHPERGGFTHTRRSSGALVAARYVLDSFEAVDQGNEVAAWLSETVGREVRLISCERPWKTNLPLPQFARMHQQPKSRFFPVSPVSISNVASLDDLNARLETPVPMNRFRMNIVVDGLAPWEEERIERIGGASVKLEGVTVAERCIIVTTDQETGERTKSDVLGELGKFHRRPRPDRFGSGLAFGTYLSVASEGVVALGERLQVELGATKFASTG